MDKPQHDHDHIKNETYEDAEPFLPGSRRTFREVAYEEHEKYLERFVGKHIDRHDLY